MKAGKRKTKSKGVLSCKYCGRVNFKNAAALTKHQDSGFCAQLKNEEQLRLLTPGLAVVFARTPGESSDTEEDNATDFPYFSPPTPPKKRQPVHIPEANAHDNDNVAMSIGAILDAEADAEEDEESDTSENFGYIDKESGVTGPDSDGEDPFSSSEEEDSDQEDKKPEGSPDPGGFANVKGAPNTYIRDQFKEYCEDANQNFIPFSDAEKAAIRCLHLLKAKNAPLNAYESVLRWHLIEAKKMRPHESLQDSPYYIGRKTLIKGLIKRYNYENKMPYQKAVRLPVSGTLVRITCHSAQATIQRLLTDPRIVPEDYLFWDGNPLQGPPEKLDYVADLNTGLAYRETYAEICTKEGQQLMPIVLYSDGTAVSHFHDMEIIQVNIALGTMTREARNKPHCWAPLGYVEKVHEHGGRGKDILAQANHLETQDGVASVDSEETVINASETMHLGETNAQDFHMMMGVILEEFVDLQTGGFVWDHHDPVIGEDTPDIHYQIFVPFFKADSKEADLYAGKYAQRFSTQQLCRKCHVPLQEADNHLAEAELKTQTEIHNLVIKGDLGALKQISQTYLSNCFYNIRFSMGNDFGIHGSCPSELLHAFLLGTFKYLRDIFFEMIGKDSEGARQMNALSKVYSRYFARQSDRTIPGTSFTKGIQVGKLMGKDYRGVLVIILAMVRSTKGRAILNKYRKFKKESDLDDWILLVELMLEWESYLNSPVMRLKHVKRLDKKHRFIMYIMRKVAQRSKGMGLKLVKFHMITHIMDDILQFGVPLEYDTSSNESMHKPSKKASKMTQRAAETFNFQVANRLIEFQLLDLAMVEIETGRVPWDYYHRHSRSKAAVDGQENEIWTGETKILIHANENGEVGFRLRTRSKYAAKAAWNVDVIDFLYGLQCLVQPYIAGNFMPIYTCHRRKGQTFRGHPHYRGKGPWKDWVWVDWGAHGRVPCHIWCFVVLENMPSGRNVLHYGGIPLSNGVFAVVESSEIMADEAEVTRSDLLMPISKEIEIHADKSVGRRTFYLADTEAFEGPCCAIPDIGGPPNKYFVVLPRQEWKDPFIQWIEDPHTLDVMEEMDVKTELEADNSVDGEEAFGSEEEKSSVGRSRKAKTARI